MSNLNNSNTTLIENENGTYSLWDNDFDWAIANGTRKEMLKLQSQLNTIDRSYLK